MSSNIHSLKNRPGDAPKKVREAFDSWTELISWAKAVGLDASTQTLSRAYLGHLVLDKQGGLDDLAWLAATRVVTTQQIIDWELSVSA
jgi:hypothetical protein